MKSPVTSIGCPTAYVCVPPGAAVGSSEGSEGAPASDGSVVSWLAPAGAVAAAGEGSAVVTPAAPASEQPAATRARAARTTTAPVVPRIERCFFTADLQSHCGTRLSASH